MSLRLSPIAIGAAAALSALIVAAPDARACGGCFHPEEQTETTVVTGHRMAFAISPTQTVLWDQIQYAGAPDEFAWVLPVKPGGYIELSTDAWFEALDAATSTRVAPPQLDCFSQGFSEGSDSRGCGCSAQEDAAAGLDPRSANGEPPPPVTVVHEGTVGPYQTVTLHSDVPGALSDWLTSNGFAIDDEIQPIIDQYVAEGFDFIALRLAPNQGVQQMKPVRAVSPGASPTLPLRMVAAGTGANVDLTLFILGEGRWEAGNFPNGVVDPADLSWDFNTDESNYAETREGILALGGGRTWLSAYAQRRALLSPVTNPLSGGPVMYSVDTRNEVTIADLYVWQGIANGEADTTICTDAFSKYETSESLVVDVCEPAPDGGGGGGAGGGGGGGAGGGVGGGGAGGAGEVCGEVGEGQIDARELACGALDDVAVALTGMHPADVWVSRIEAQLPRAALGDDLVLAPANPQIGVENWLQATQAVDPPCPVATAAAAFPAPGDEGMSSRRRTDLALIAAGIAAAAAALARRARRPGLTLAPGRG